MGLQGWYGLGSGPGIHQIQKSQVILPDPVSMPQKPRALPPNSQSYGEMLPERAEALPVSVVRWQC